MEPFPILTDPAPSLRECSRELGVEEVTTAEFQTYLDQLIHTMRVADGVGIASPQVGKNVRALVVNMRGQPACFINPEIIKKSETLVESEEGCLSVPGRFGIVKRHTKVTIRALNRHGRRIELKAKQFPAIIFQHEIDHLDGILFIDKMIKSLEGRHTKI